MKNLRSRIKSYLFDTNLRWSEIHARIQIGVPIKPHMKDEYIETEEKLVKLFRSWALGCVGEDVDIPDDLSTYSKGSLLGNNQAKQRIRKKIEMDTSK